MHVYALTTFDKERTKQLSNEQNKQLDTFIQRLRDDSQQAKPLKGRWLYEVKLQGKRVYYVSIKDSALFVEISTKKNQQEKIDELVKRKSPLLDILRQLST